MTLPPDSYCPYCCTFSGECACTPADESEQFENIVSAAARFMPADAVDRNYRALGWATPISGDATTIRKKFIGRNGW